MSTWDDLIESAWRDIRDADRCVALSITPAAYQLHRRLRQVTQAMEALLTGEAVERAADAVHHARGLDDYGVANEDEMEDARGIARAVLNAATGDNHE